MLGGANVAVSCPGSPSRSRVSARFEVLVSDTGPVFGKERLVSGFIMQTGGLWHGDKSIMREGLVVALTTT